MLNEDYAESDWKKDGRKINLNIKNLENAIRIIKEKIDKEKDDKNNGNLQEIEEYTTKVEEEILPLIKRIKEKTQYFNLEEQSQENNNPQNNNAQPEGVLIQDLQSNQEILKERGKQLNEIHKTSAMLKDVSDAMVKKLDEQGAILDEVEGNVIEAEDNAKKAKQEITKADEMSKGNRKKMICLITIVIVAILAIGAIILSLIF